MVNTSPPSFEKYFSTEAAPLTRQQNDSRVFQYVLVGGLILTGALAMYFAIRNSDLKSTIKSLSPDIDNH